MTGKVKCQICKKNEAIWARQFIAEDTPSWYAIGSHIRGFFYLLYCDDCKEREQKQWNKKEAIR